MGLGSVALGLVLAELGLRFSTRTSARGASSTSSCIKACVSSCTGSATGIPVTRFLLFFYASSRYVKANLHSGGEGEGSAAYENLQYEEFIVSDSARNSFASCLTYLLTHRKPRQISATNTHTATTITVVELSTGLTVE